MKAVVVLLLPLVLPTLGASVLPIGSYFPFGDSSTTEGTAIPTTTEKGIDETKKSASNEDEGLTEDQYYDYYYGDERSGSGDHHSKEGEADDEAEASGDDNMRRLNETQEEQEVRNYLQMMHRIRF